LTGVLGLTSLVAAAAISFGLLFFLRPLLARYALARPNARSSHREPTPQGGGIAVIVATTIVVCAASLFLRHEPSWSLELVVVFTSTIFLALVGVTDDLRPLEAMPRLLLQALAVAVVLSALPTDLRVFPFAAWWFERLVLFAALLWFVNLVNFMDGIDWMTVAEVIPIAAALAIFGLMGALPSGASLVAFVLCGATIGFAPFNRPVAQLFLGDVGSLPIGLILGWLLVLLAGNGHLAAALLLPLYYLGDATITLLRRLANGERITQAHQNHFYQRATDKGFSVNQIVGRVFVTNIVLIGLAAVTLACQSTALHAAMVVTGSGIVGLLLWSFDHRPGSSFSLRP